MTFNQLKNKLATIGFTSDREYLLYEAGFKGLYHLGEQGVKGLHLMDATPDQVIEFVESN